MAKNLIPLSLKNQTKFERSVTLSLDGHLVQRKLADGRYPEQIAGLNLP
jgi:hypothetical protein